MNHKSLFIILTFLILILFLFIGGVAYSLYSREFISKKIEKKDLFKASVNNLVLNITNNSGRIKLMKLSFTLKSSEVNIEQVIDGYKAEMIDLIISLVSTRNSEELLTLEGKQLFKKALLENMNKKLNSLFQNDDKISNDNIIQKIFFTTIVMK